jgi:transcriptional regulator with XRE-family HTH domain
MTWDKVKTLMEKNGLTSKEIAAIAGVVPSAITKWKAGSSIRTDALQRIAVHFGVSSDWLLGNETFGSRLKQSRERAGITPEELGKKVEAKATYILGLENGVHPPTDGLSNVLAPILGVTVEWLQDGIMMPGMTGNVGPCIECAKKDIEIGKKQAQIERLEKIIDKLMK